VGYNVVMGLSTPGISNAAHIGGLIAGIVLGAVLGRPLPLDRRRRQAAPRMIAGLLLSGALIAGGIYAIPRIDQTPAGKLAAMENRFLSEEREMEKIIISLGGQITPEYSETIKTQILPRLDAMIAWLKQIDFKSRAEYVQEHQLKLTFAEERRRGFALIVRGMEAGDNKMMQEGVNITEDAMKTYNNVIRAQKVEPRPANP
jgi:hypothetical protein